MMYDSDFPNEAAVSILLERHKSATSQWYRLPVVSRGLNLLLAAVLFVPGRVSIALLIGGLAFALMVNATWLLTMRRLARAIDGIEEVLVRGSHMEDAYVQGRVTAYG